MQRFLIFFCYFSNIFSSKNWTFHYFVMKNSIFFSNFYENPIFNVFFNRAYIVSLSFLIQKVHHIFENNRDIITGMVECHRVEEIIHEFLYCTFAKNSSCYNENSNFLENFDSKNLKILSKF